jgi:putative ABC transport system permease protein
MCCPTRCIRKAWADGYCHGAVERSAAWAIESHRSATCAPASMSRSVSHPAAKTLPAGVVVRTPTIERGRASTATRAYRVNLNMLALVALLTGAFLVFSTQSLAVLRRRTALGLLRALGVTRTELRRALLGEGAPSASPARFRVQCSERCSRRWYCAIWAAAWATASWWRSARCSRCSRWRHCWPSSRWARQRRVWVPIASARSGAARARTGDESRATPSRRWRRVSPPAGVALHHRRRRARLAAADRRRPGARLSGDRDAADRIGAADTDRDASFTRALPRTGRVEIDTAVRPAAGQRRVSTVSVACIIVSFSLMVAMAIMVHSFRTSFDLWLVKLLPADLQLRVSLGSDTGALSFAQQQRISAYPAWHRRNFGACNPSGCGGSPPVTLIARDFGNRQRAAEPAAAGADRRYAAPRGSLRRGYPRPWPTNTATARRHASAFRCWAARTHGSVAGIWRDYARPDGAS